MIEARPESSPPRDLRCLFDAQRDAYAREPYPSLTLRHDRLERLAALIEEHEQEIVASVGPMSGDDFVVPGECRPGGRTKRP